MPSAAPWSTSARREKTAMSPSQTRPGTYCAPMPTAIASSTGSVTCCTGVWTPEKSCLRMSAAVENESARKNTHPKQTKLKVMSRRHIRFAGESGRSGSPRQARNSAQPCSTQSPMPWMPPQTTKVHAAPCQSPPRSITIIRLRYVATRPWRLPPSGM